MVDTTLTISSYRGVNGGHVTWHVMQHGIINLCMLKRESWLQFCIYTLRSHYSSIQISNCPTYSDDWWVLPTVPWCSSRWWRSPWHSNWMNLRGRRISTTNGSPVGEHADGGGRETMEREFKIWQISSAYSTKRNRASRLRVITLFHRLYYFMSFRFWVAWRRWTKHSLVSYN